MPAEFPIAVAVNGKIAGLGWTFAPKGRAQMAVVVSPRYFRPGANFVDVYKIGGQGQLELVPRTPVAADEG
jgi:hypothetical protein